MKTSDRHFHTYIQESTSPSVQEQTIAHLCSTGQFPTDDPNVFESMQMVEPITAGFDFLDLEHSIPMHSHSFMEIFYYMSGNNIGYLVGDHRYVLQKGDVVIIPPGVWHCTLRTSRSTEPCTRHLIGITSDYMERMNMQELQRILSSMETPHLIRTSGTPMEYLERLFDICTREFQKKEVCWQETINGCIQILFAQITRCSQSSNYPVITAQKDGIFEKSLAYLNQHLTGKLTLAETAQALYTSERTITREFQKNMGLSFYKYVTLRRLELAAQLLAGNIPLEEISERVGFADYPTFYRAFKKQFGCSPRQMRESQQEAQPSP